MRLRKSASLLALTALLGSCAPDARPDPAQFTSAVTLRDAIDRAARAYHVPAELLTAVAWSETRFGDPRATDDHPHSEGTEPGGESIHDVPEYGPLHLRPAPARGVDTLARARALLGSSEAELRDNLGLSVAGAAAVLAELGAQTGARANDLASWAEAVARYSGQPERALQVSYAAQVFDALHAGVRGESYTGESLAVAAHAGLPPASDLLDVRQAVQASGDYGPALWVPASTSNYTSGRQGARVQYVVIHTMQGSYAGSISWFRNSAAQASAHYNIRSSDGEITQMVDEDNTAWHAGNWHYNTHSVGIEHEGFVADPGRWYTDAMYRSSARLTRMLCDRYNIPIDRAHIIGHYQIPPSGTGAPCATNSTTCGGAGRHSDPGSGGRGWDWDRFMALVRGSGTTPPPPPPPPPPAYNATLVNVSCPATATSGERPVAYVEYRNTGTATWTRAGTFLGTSNPRDHNGVFFDQVNWRARNRPTEVDHDTAPNATQRFSFVLGIPDVTTETTLSENYALVQEGVTWFGPADTAVRCSVRVSPRTPPPPVDAGAPPPPPPVDAGNEPPVALDAGGNEPPRPEDSGNGDPPEPVDVPVVTDRGNPTRDAGNPSTRDAGSTTTGGEEDAGSRVSEIPDEGSCGCKVGPGANTSGGTSRTGAAALLGLAAVAVVPRRRRRR